LVFPEYGLTTLVDPEDYALEIHADEKVITELATMATERQMYLVVNLLEKARDDRNNTKYYKHQSSVREKRHHNRKVRISIVC
jgi:predicted amidohydrolase